MKEGATIQRMRILLLTVTSPGQKRWRRPSSDFTAMPLPPIPGSASCIGGTSTCKAIAGAAVATPMACGLKTGGCGMIMVTGPFGQSGGGTTQAAVMATPVPC